MLLENNKLSTEQLGKYNVTPEMIDLGVSYNGVDLVCEDFESFEIHKMIYAIQMFDIHGLGGKAYHQIAKLLNEPHDIFRIPDNNSQIDILKTTIGPSKTQTLLKGLENMKEKGVELWKLVIGLQVEGCGRTIAKQFAKYYTSEICEIPNITYSFESLTKSVIEELKTNGSKLNSVIAELNSMGINIIYPEVEKQISNDAIFYVMTGSPKEFGFKTKAEFQQTLPENWIEQKALNSETTYLICDDVDSKSSKMTKAKKQGTKAILYSASLFN